jgi:predicted enzyme related to lactoylglutathione lyase
MARFLIELPANEPERARRFWEELLELTLESRRPEQGRGWQAEYDGIVFGLHERGPGPGDRFSLPYFPVADLDAAVGRVRALGGEIVHPGERWVICRDCECTPFGLAGSTSEWCSRPDRLDVAEEGRPRVHPPARSADPRAACPAPSQRRQR